MPPPRSRRWFATSSHGTPCEWGAPLNVASFVLERARKEPDAPALHFPVGRREGGRVRYARTTNRELDVESDWIARGLVSAGIGRGVRTVLMVRPSLELFALTLAVIVLASRSAGRNQHHLWTAAALVGMGILDICHAAVAPGEAFVWFHSTATFMGGVLFGLVWLPGRVADSPRCRLVLPLTIGAVLGLCFCSLGLPRMVPAMVVHGSFTTTARGLNVIGGLGFLAAAAWFLNRYRVAQRWDDCLFACLCCLFGAAGVLFELSSLWDAAW